MNVIDSSGWLEFFADAPNADFFAKPIQNAALLVVPTLSIFEVFKKIAHERSEGDALQAVAERVAPPHRGTSGGRARATAERASR